VADSVTGANPEHGADGDDPSRRDFIHIAAGVAALGAVATVAWPVVDQMNPAGDTLALASVEFDLTKVQLGQSVTIKWRGKPLFIRHRTGAEIAAALLANALLNITGSCRNVLTFALCGASADAPQNTVAAFRLIAFVVNGTIRRSCGAERPRRDRHAPPSRSWPWCRA